MATKKKASKKTRKVGLRGSVLDHAAAAASAVKTAQTDGSCIARFEAMGATKAHMRYVGPGDVRKQLTAALRKASNKVSVDCLCKARD